MEKISINLLPVEVTKSQIEQKKFYKIRFISIIITLLMFFSASTTLALRILQNKNIDGANFTLQAAEEKVSQYKDIEISLVVLKDRITNINKIISIPSTQVTMYNLIYDLLPSSVNINSMSVDRSGSIELSTISPNVTIVDDFISDLVDEQKNQGKIALVDVENLTRSRDGFYRINLKIKAK